MGDVYRRKHSKFYWMRVVNPITGEVIRKSTKKKTKRDSLKVLSLYERDLIEKGDKKEYFEYSLKKILQIYYEYGERKRLKGGSLYNIEKNTKNLLRFFDGSMRCVDLSKRMISDYIIYRQNKGISNGSILGELSCLRSGINYGIELDYLPVSLKREIKWKGLKGNVRKDFLEVWEYKQIREHLPDYLKDVLDVGYFTGMRIGEIKNLKWKSVDVSRGEFNLMETKTDERRSIVLIERLKTRIKELYDEKIKSMGFNTLNFPNEYVFTKPDGGKLNYIYTSWRTSCKKCGFVDEDGKPNKTFHSTRRSCVRNLVRSGVSEKVCMMITGHKSRSIFDRYNIVRESELESGMEMLDVYVKNVMKDVDGKV